jgi:hypothetical protein
MIDDARPPLGHNPEELADIARCEEVARQRAELAAAFPPDAKRVCWSDDTLSGETRAHAMWRFMRERGQPIAATFPAYLRSMFDDARAGHLPPVKADNGYTWEKFLREMYDFALEKGYAGTWEDFLREADR